MPKASSCGIMTMGSLLTESHNATVCCVAQQYTIATELADNSATPWEQSQFFSEFPIKKAIGGSLTTAAYTPETKSIQNLCIASYIINFLSGLHIKTTNVRSRREVTAEWCVAQHRRCVADLATSQSYIYEVLGAKADTIDAEHLRHTLYKISHPSRHRSVIVFTEINKNERESLDCRSPSRNKFCKNY